MRLMVVEKLTMRFMKWLKRFGWVLLVIMIGPAYMGIFENITLGADWRTADRSSAGLAPDPASTSEAVVQVYAARAFNWRGLFAVHTWISTKPENASAYTVHEVLGWRLEDNLPVVSSQRDLPDRAWYGSKPEVLVDVRGQLAAELIPQIFKAAKDYPYQRTYVMWPGPNSNTFTAWVGRQVPDLKLDLPTTAVGKDFLGGFRLVDNTPSGTGMQFSLLGMLGLAAGKQEGVELNVLGFNLGVDPLGGALKLPGVGRVGLPTEPRITR